MIEEIEVHEATIDLKEGADAFAVQCIEACEDVDGKADLEAVTSLAWNIIGVADRTEEFDWEGFALRVGIAIGQRIKPE